MTARCLMLVEDNAIDEKLTLRAFKKCGFANPVVVARDGAEALEYLFGTGRHAGREVRELPAVVLLDLNLPRISGLDVLRQLRADPRTRLLPVVILTGSNQAEDVARGYDLGANAYVRKPVDFVEFAAATRTLGAYWLTLNQVTPTGSR